MKTVIIAMCLVCIALPTLAQSSQSNVQDLAVKGSDPLHLLHRNLPANFAAKLEAQPPEPIDPSIYASRFIVLVSPRKDVSAVVPIGFTVNGKTYLTFVDNSTLAESVAKGGKPIRYGEVLSALGEAMQTIQGLQKQNAALHQENERLWKVAMKGNSRPIPQPVIIREQPSKLEQYLLIRSMFPPVKPYQLPPPLPVPRAPINCTTSAIGNTAYTNCN